MLIESHSMRKRARSLALLLLSLSATAFIALAHPVPSPAVEYHTTCVGHGFVAGSSSTDGSFFSRIETGCGTTNRECKIYNYGTFVGSEITSTTTCNAWSNSFGNYTECASYAKLNFPAAFSEHNHTPNNYCASLKATASDSISAIEPIPDAPMKDSAEFMPAGAEVIGVTAADPDGGPDFAVRVYRSETGDTCPEAGRVRDGRFGQQYATGWQELPAASAGACSDLDDQGVGFAVSNHLAQGDIPAYAIVYGSVSDNIASLAVQLDGQTTNLSLASGTFLVPTRDAVIAKGATLAATTTSGQKITYLIPTPTVG